MQLLCMFRVWGPVQSSVLHETAPGRARAAGWGRTTQERVVWAVRLSELGASGDKGKNPALELRKGTSGVLRHPPWVHPKCLAFLLENKISKASDKGKGRKKKRARVTKEKSRGKRMANATS